MSCVDVCRDAEKRVSLRLVPQMVDARIRIREVAKSDCARWASRLTRGNDFTFANFAVFLFGRAACLADALDAIRALFHHAAAANSDVRIEHGFDDLVAKLLYSSPSA